MWAKTFAAAFFATVLPASMQTIELFHTFQTHVSLWRFMWTIHAYFATLTATVVHFWMCAPFLDDGGFDFGFRRSFF